MLGVKLRSERIDLYDVLGERGQPVYLAAAQILTSLTRHNPNLARHFSVPQPSDDGSRIDWYAPADGAVITWASATQAETEAATAQLNSLQKELNDLHAALLAKNGSGQRSLFSQLLPWVLHHPDPSHIYIVDGTPVLTFWGFQAAGADRNIAPFHALSPVSTPLPDMVATPVAPLAPPAAAAAPAILTTTLPWWKRWWWWLLLLLLLALLFLGVRACMPIAPIPLVPTITTSQQEVPAPRDTTALSVTPLAPAAGGRNNQTTPVAVVATPATSSVAVDTAPTSALVPAAGSSSAAPEATPKASTAPGSSAAPTVAPPADTPTIPAETPQPPALNLPPELPQGQATFLNGDWLVRAGIQDKATGQPLRLQYTFEHGEGQVALKRSNGTECQAPVSAAIDEGALTISSNSQATCNDGNVFDMPTIRCVPGATDIASCSGHYGDFQVPLTMRQNRP